MLQKRKTLKLSTKLSDSGTGLSKEQEDSLIKVLNLFSEWIVEKGISSTATIIDRSIDFPYANEDWVMIVDSKNRAVSFNTFVVQKCSFEYYQIVVLHEYFHLVVQKVPNKEDAVRVKDDFGDELMKLIDIEADFFTALFCREKLNYDLVSYLRLYWEGNKIFANKKIRAVKFERFIGSILSICKMFINSHGIEDTVRIWDLYLPSIRTVYTEDRLHILVIRKEHIYFDEIKASYTDLIELKKCYSNIDTYTAKGYIEALVAFSVKALKIKLPKEIKLQITKIK